MGLLGFRASGTFRAWGFLEKNQIARSNLIVSGQNNRVSGSGPSVTLRP